MTIIGILAVLLFSLLFTSVFVFGLGAKGPWGSGWTFFVIIALVLSTVTLWVPPAGPVWYGAAWVDLLITGLLISFILSAVTPSHDENFNGDVMPGDTHTKAHGGSVAYHKHTHQRKALFTTGSFFWMILLFLCAMIILGAV